MSSTSSIVLELLVDQGIIGQPWNYSGLDQPEITHHLNNATGIRNVMPHLCDTVSMYIDPNAIVLHLTKSVPYQINIHSRFVNQVQAPTGFTKFDQSPNDHRGYRMGFKLADTNITQAQKVAALFRAAKEMVRVIPYL